MNSKNIKKLITIVGPTASGKTGLAVFLAKQLGGEIVSADSRQVYKGLDIGTGKDLEDYGDVKYHLIDICEPGEKFTMFDWLERARSVIEDIFSRGKLPIVVGGTGLYVQALVEGFHLVKSEKRKAKSNKSKSKIYSREELERMPLLVLQKITQIYLSNEANKASEANKLDFKNPHRLIRFIERAQSGEQMVKIKPDFEVLQIGIDLPRKELYQKIDKRVEEWFKSGFYEEVTDLLSCGVDMDWLNRIGLEYKILANYIQYQELKNKNENLEIIKLLENSNLKIENISSLESVKQTMKFAIHAYARRQLTWLRRFPQIKWAKNKEEALKLVQEFMI